MESKRPQYAEQNEPDHLGGGSDSKKRKMEQPYELTSSSTSDKSSQLRDTLVTQAGQLLRKATILRCTPSVPTSHPTLKEIMQVWNHDHSNTILSLHKRLHRLETEHAKAVVMIEQIRRCNANPYPAWDQSQQIKAGVERIGPLVELEGDGGGFVFPQYINNSQMPESPYMEHYEKWLIPDPRVAPRVIVEQQGVSSSGRSTRTNPLSCASEQDAAAKTGAVSEFHPLVMKNSNGLWVQLRCWAGKCGGASGYRNIQGFVNHRRTLHGIRHPTHMDAADVCGEEIHMSEEMESAYEAKDGAKDTTKAKSKKSSIVPEESAVNYDGPTTKRRAARQTEVVDVVRLAPNDLQPASKIGGAYKPAHSSTVHPFNKSDAKLPTGPTATARQVGDDQLDEDIEEAASLQSDPASNQAPSFSRSSSVEHLAVSPHASEPWQNKTSSFAGKSAGLATATRTMEAEGATAMAKPDDYQDDYTDFEGNDY